MASFEALSDFELREKLLVFGYDLPVSINREFLERKLEKVTAERSRAQNTGRRKSTPAFSPQATAPGNYQPQQTSPSPSSYLTRRSTANSAAPTPTLRKVREEPSSDDGGGDLSNSTNSRTTTSSSSRFQSYLNYFKGDTRSDPPTPGSNQNFQQQQNQMGPAGGSPLPTRNGYYTPVGSPYSSSGGTPAPANVPPHLAAGRQAGFKAFFSRGERNGYGGYSSNGGGTTDWASSSHLISKIILAMFIVTFVGIGGIYYYKSTVSMESGKGLTAGGGGTRKSGLPTSSVPPPVATPPPNKKVISTSMVYPICTLKGVDPEACVPKEQIKNSRTLLTALKEELIQRARMKGCGGGDVEDSISLQSAKSLLYRLTDLKKSEVDSAFNGMLLLVTENINSGLRIESKEFLDEEISSRAVQTLDNNIATITAVGVSANILCTVWSGLYALIGYSVFVSLLVGVGYGSWIGWKYHKGRKVREEHEVFGLIEKVLEMLYTQYEHSKSSGGDSYIAVNHIRDDLLSPRDRKKKEALWNQVVDHISTHESRVREEIQHISGEEFRVWRWLPSASPLVSTKYSTPSSSPMMGRHSLPAQRSPLTSLNPGGLYPNISGMGMDLDSSGGGSPMTNKWQGQAFEMCDGSPNALPIIPTTCLKIRQMFDTEKDSAESGQNRIERAILEKCPNSKVLHIGIETGSQEGCVYVRCQSKEDARSAYMDLHGWWFDGHLLSVKFLREQRYFTRFPEAKYRTVPLTMSTLSSPIVQPLAGQQTFSNSMNIRSGNNNAGPATGPGTSARVRYTMGY